MEQDTILITGGCGFLGAELAHVLLAREPGRSVVLTDIVQSPRLQPLKDTVTFIQGDLSDPQFCRDLVTENVSTVFHLASLVSGGAEQDFEAGMKANVYATIWLLEACRLQGRKPRFIFASSIATFGGRDLPAEVTDWTYQHPQNSYGVAKVVGEQLLNDYSRKGYVDGRGVRLPAIVVRDVPNTALSGYASNLIREPLQGQDSVCPVGPQTRIPIMSARQAIAFLIRLAGLPEGELGDYRTLNGRGISPSAGEIAAAVRRLAPADRPLGAIRFEPDPGVQGIIDSWPQVMHAGRASALGLPVDDSIASLVLDYVRCHSERSEGSRLTSGAKE